MTRRPELITMPAYVRQAVVDSIIRQPANIPWLTWLPVSGLHMSDFQMCM